MITLEYGEKVKRNIEMKNTFFCDIFFSDRKWNKIMSYQKKVIKVQIVYVDCKK